MPSSRPDDDELAQRDGGCVEVGRLIIGAGDYDAAGKMATRKVRT